MFCPKCGSKQVVDVFCKNCLKEEKPLVSSFKEFKAEVCTRSGTVRFHGKWHPTDDPTARLGELFKKQVIIAPYATVERVAITLDEIPLKDGLKVTGEAAVAVTGTASPKAKPYVEEYIVPYEIQNTISPRWAKHRTNYFEGVLQVRNEDEDRKRFVLDTLHRCNAGVSKQTKQKHGTDYFVTSKSAIEKTARALVEHYGGAVKSSAHLFGHDKLRSKDVYRTTWFVELPPFSAGDAVRHGKDTLFVRDLGKRIRFYNPKRDKNEQHEYKQDEWHVLPVLETSVAATHPELTVLHPETFQAVPVANAKRPELTPGERVKVVLNGRRVYIM